MSKEEILGRIADAVISGDEDAAKASANKAIEAGVPPLDAIVYGVCAGLNVVGKKYEAKEYFYPDLVVSADTAMSAIGVIKSHKKEGQATSYIGKYVLGSVEGDLHDIGKDLVKTMLEASGFEVIDLGIDVPSSKFVEAVKMHNADIVGSSATLAGGIKMKQKEIEAALREAGVRDKVKTMIGGIVTDETWAKEIGADSWGENCLDAARKAEELMKKIKEERKK